MVSKMPATITLKNIPDSIHAALKNAAETNHRSLNGEVIARLEQTLLQQTNHAQTHVARAVTLHQDVNKAKRTKLASIDIVAAIRADRDRR
jgi:plasmid stability protein